MQNKIQAEKIEVGTYISTTSRSKIGKVNAISCMWAAGGKGNAIRLSRDLVIIGAVSTAAPTDFEKEWLVYPRFWFYFSSIKKICSAEWNSGWKNWSRYIRMYYK